MSVEIYKAKMKRTNSQGREFWVHGAFTVMLGTNDRGERTVTLIDERTDQRWPCFQPERRSDPPPATAPQYGTGPHTHAAPPHTDDDVPW